MRLPRFTTRRLMVIVAVLALVLGAIVEIGTLRRRAADYRAKASAHADMEVIWKSIIKTSGAESPVDVYHQPDGKGTRTTARAVLEHETKLRAAYEFAAQYPWLPVEPDPPPPN